MMGRWVQGEGGPYYRITKSEADFLSAKILMMLTNDDRLRGGNRVTLQRLAEDMGAAPEPRKPRRSTSRSVSGPVTITDANGSVSTQPPMSAAELRRIAPERLPIYPVLRIRILKRDMQTCRYCMTIVGPFEIDHVIPVAQGGETALFNLVTACQDCNRRKGNQVWRPVRLAVVRARARKALG